MVAGYNLYLSTSNKSVGWTFCGCYEDDIITFHMRYNTSEKETEFECTNRRHTSLNTADTVHIPGTGGKKHNTIKNYDLPREPSHCTLQTNPHWLLLLPLLLLQRSPGPPPEAGGCTLSARL